MTATLLSAVVCNTLFTFERVCTCSWVFWSQQMGGRTQKYHKDISSMYIPRWSSCSKGIVCTHYILIIKTLRPRQTGRHFPDDIFKWIFLNENVWISIKNSLRFVPGCLINNMSALVQIMAWRRPGQISDTYCVTRPQWVKSHQIPTVRDTLFCTEIPYVFKRLYHWLKRKGYMFDQ